MRLVILLSFLLLPVLSIAQPTWLEHTIDGSVEGVHEVIAADVDGDGDNDALYTSYYENGLTWWENVDTLGLTWAEHAIDLDVQGTVCLAASDLDGDSDTDIISGSHAHGTVSWWENTDGIGTTWTEHAISVLPVEYPRSIVIADINSDSYPDVICAADSGSDVMYWSNDNGDGASWTRNSVNDFFSHAWDLDVLDMNGDGYLDLLGASYWGDKLSTFKNADSLATTWIVHTQVSQYNGPSCVRAIDMDNDGDDDYLSCSYFRGDFSWWENINGNGSEFAQHLVYRQYSATNIDVADVDLDGDWDLLCGVENGNNLLWFENADGNGLTWTQQTVGPALGLIYSAIFCDMDGDTDIDVLVAAGRTFTWWEQEGSPTPSPDN
jgi:FG-GAP-like repeat